MRDIQKLRMHHNIRAAYKYASEKGKKIEQLTIDEINQFAIRPWSFRECYRPMNHREECFICRTKTNKLDKIHTVYICSEKCMNEVDRKYDLAEEIPRNEKAYKILSDVERDLFE